jgi:hypothetical protein
MRNICKFKKVQQRANACFLFFKKTGNWCGEFVFLY